MIPKLNNHSQTENHSLSAFNVASMTSENELAITQNINPLNRYINYLYTFIKVENGNITIENETTETQLKYRINTTYNGNRSLVEDSIKKYINVLPIYNDFYGGNDWIRENYNGISINSNNKLDICYFTCLAYEDGWVGNCKTIFGSLMQFCVYKLD